MNTEATSTGAYDDTTAKIVTRRASTDADLDFLRAVYESTRAGEMAIVDWSEEQKRDFLRMQFHAQHTFYHDSWPEAQYDILEFEGERIGRIYVNLLATEIRLMDIALLPPFQNQGIGSSLMQKLMADAIEAGIPITLHVEVFNRAQELYARLGFKRVREDGLYLLMEWNPSNA